MSTKSIASIALMMTMLPACAFPLFPGYELEGCEFDETCEEDDDGAADEDETTEDEDDDAESPAADEAEEEEKEEEVEPAVFTKAGSWVGTCFIENGAEVELELVIGDNGLGHLDLEHASSTFSVIADGWSDGDAHEVVADVGNVLFRLDLTTISEDHLKGRCQQMVAERAASGGGESTAGEVICTIFTLGLANCGGGTPSHQTRWVVEHEGELDLVEMD